MSSEIGLTGFGLLLSEAEQMAASAKYWHILYSKDFNREEDANAAFAVVTQVHSVLANSFDIYVRAPTSITSAVDFGSGLRKWNVYSRFSVSLKEPK